MAGGNGLQSRNIEVLDGELPQVFLRERLTFAKCTESLRLTHERLFENISYEASVAESPLSNCIFPEIHKTASFSLFCFKTFPADDSSMKLSRNKWSKPLFGNLFKGCKSYKCAAAHPSIPFRLPLQTV